MSDKELLRVWNELARQRKTYEEIYKLGLAQFESDFNKWLENEDEIREKVLTLFKEVA